MKIALIGFGKMGQEIATLAIAEGHEIVLKINSENAAELTIANLQKAEVAIEFSNPSLVQAHIQICLAAGVPIVVGTTAWQQDLPKVNQLVSDLNGSLLHASNFSVGVNIFFEINRKLAEIMNKHKEYTVSMEEIHHLQKLDAPSGTAVSLANDIIEVHDQYEEWHLASENEANQSIAINALREPNVPGTHEVSYNSEIDSIRIEHIAHNRSGFALGAVLAAEFLYGKEGIFTMKDVLN